MEPGTTITITRNGGRFVATLKAPSESVVRFASTARASDALDIFGIATEARLRIDALFMFARVDEIRLVAEDGWKSELRYWRNGELRVHFIHAITLLAIMEEHITFLWKGEYK